MCRQLHMREISIRVEMWGRTLAVFDKMISQDCLGVLRGTWCDYKDGSICCPWKLSSRRGQSSGRHPLRERGAVLTWTQTHRCAASCCPVGSAAAFCICLGLLLHSRRAAHRSASSWFHLWPRPTLNLMSGRSKRRKDEGVTERRRRSKYKKMDRVAKKRTVKEKGNSGPTKMHRGRGEEIESSIIWEVNRLTQSTYL